MVATLAAAGRLAAAYILPQPGEPPPKAAVVVSTLAEPAP
jgi:hypothetical protein